MGGGYNYMVRAPESDSQRPTELHNRPTSCLIKYFGVRWLGRLTDGVAICYTWTIQAWTVWNPTRFPFCITLVLRLFLDPWIGPSGFELRVMYMAYQYIFSLMLDIGYWFLDDADVGAKKWTPPEDLLCFIDCARQAGKKIVYIGFGSIVVPDPRAMTRCVVDAIVQSGVYAILSKGWSDRLHTQTTQTSQPEEPLPEQIYSISSVPHDWLFKRIDAACHHGGAGTTGASLRGSSDSPYSRNRADAGAAGIPTIIKPFFGDQFFWADRIEALGIGTGVRKFTVDNLSQALTTATTDPKQIERARAVGEKIRSVSGLNLV